MGKLLFIQNLEYEFMGPMYISAVLKSRGHSVRLAAAKDYGAVLAAAREFGPDVAAFPVMTGAHRWALETGRRLKKDLGLFTLFGGPHTTFFPEFIEEDGVDAICRGEGEEAALELLEALDAGRPVTGISNLYVKSGGTIHRNPVRCLRPEIDSFPFCDRELYAALPHGPDREVKSVITSRGCVYKCTFCFEESMKALYRDKGRYVRFRSAESVIAELKEIKARYAPRTIYFCDDVFGINKQWLYGFLETYKKEIGLEFFCLIRADIAAAEPEYAKRLFAAGCRVVFFGIETGSERLRNEVLKKGLTDADICKAAENLHVAGIKFRTYNILGLPDETLEDAFGTVGMNIRIKADYPWCSIFSPYPRTELAAYAADKGYLPRDFSPDDIPQSFFIASSLRMKDIRKIENLHKFFQTAVLWPRTLPLIKWLVRLPPNIFFRLWFGLVYFYCYVRSEKRDLYRTFLFALRNYRSVLTRG